MSEAADLIDWQFDLPDEDMMGIVEARRVIIVGLLDGPQTSVSVEEMVEPPINKQTVYKVMGALTLLREGFLRLDDESEKLVLTEDGQTLANGLSVLSNSR